MTFPIPKGLGSIEGLKKRFSVASERRQLWRSILQDMYDFTIPNRETFSENSPGQRKSRHLFDSTAPEALNTFVSVMIGLMTPDNVKWMKYQAGTEVPEEEKKKVNTALDKATEIFFKFLELSDFQSQVAISHQDMAISTGCLLIEEGDDNDDEPLLKFTAIPLAELYIEPTTLPRIHSFWRKHKIVAQEVMIKFPGAKLSPELTEKIAKSPTAEIEITDGSQVFNFETKEYHQVVMWGDEVIFAQDYEKSPPGVIYRWSKVAGETYGRGPTDMAMADIRTVNKVKEYTLKNAALILSPPLIAASDGVFNPHTVRVHPGVVMAAVSVDPPPIIPLQVGGDLRTGAFVLEDLQANIRKIFFADPLGETDDPVKSATEQSLRHRDMLKKRGANIGRINVEFVFAMVKRVTAILAKRGKLPKMKVNGREVGLKMKSPLADAEQQDNINNVFTYLGLIQQLPEDIQTVGAKLEAVPSYAAENLNLPEEFASSKDEIKAVKQALIQQATQAEEQAGPIDGQ